MIDYNKLKLNDHLLYTNNKGKIWLGKIIFHGLDLFLECIYSNAYSPSKRYSFQRHLCNDSAWSIPSDEQIKFCYKLVVFE